MSKISESESEANSTHELEWSKNLNIFQGDMADIQEILPSELKSIKDASDNCVKFAQQVKDMFGKMMELTGKLLEISQHATGSHQEELAKAGSYLISKIYFLPFNDFFIGVHYETLSSNQPYKCEHFVAFLLFSYKRLCTVALRIRVIFSQASVC